jgi:hypothetical protein
VVLLSGRLSFGFASDGIGLVNDHPLEIGIHVGHMKSPWLFPPPGSLDIFRIPGGALIAQGDVSLWLLTVLLASVTSMTVITVPRLMVRTPVNSLTQPQAPA